MPATLLARFMVGPYPVEVFHCPSKLADDDPDGLLDLEQRPRAIRVHERCRGSELRAVVLHELVHLAMNLFSIQLKDQSEEQIADAIALVVSEVLEKTEWREIGWSEQNGGSK